MNGILFSHCICQKEQICLLIHGKGHKSMKVNRIWNFVCKMLSILSQHQCNITHWGRNKMAAKFLPTISNVFSWMKQHKLRLRFPWNLFPMVKLTIFQHWFRLWLGAGRTTSHNLNQWWLVYWRIYASLGLNELMQHNYIFIIWFIHGYYIFISNSIFTD